MPLPSSPDPIRASEIKEEFGTINSPKIRIGQYRDATTHGGKQWPFDVGIPIGTGSDDTTTPIRFSDFHGKQLNTITVIDGSDENRVIAAEEDKEVIGGLKSNSGQGVRANARNIIYVVNKTIGSAQGSRNNCALRTGNSSKWYGNNTFTNAKINIELGEGAKLYGAGGQGGKGGNADGGDGKNGEDGTSALGIEVPTESIVVRSGAKIVAGGGGGGGGGGAKNSKAGVAGGSGGGGAGLPGASGGRTTGTGTVGSILTFEMRSSAAFVIQDTRQLVPTGEGGGTEDSDSGGWFAGELNDDGLTVSGTGYRSGRGGQALPFEWDSLADPPVEESVNMIYRDSGNGTGFRVKIRYSPWQKTADAGTSRFQTKIEIVEVLSRGENYSNGDILTTARWNSGENNAERIIRVGPVSTSASGNSGNDATLEVGGNGGNGTAQNTGGQSENGLGEGGVASGGGGGGASVIPNQSGEDQSGSGGIRGIKADDDAADGQDGDYEEGGGSGGDGDAEGGDQNTGSGGSGGENGYAITSSVGSIPAVSGSSRVYGGQASSGGVS